MHCLLLNKFEALLIKNMFTCGVFIALKKAFDTANHDILPYKLNHYGIREVAIKYFLHIYLIGTKSYP